jgi:6-phosphogluconolactonase
MKPVINIRSGLAELSREAADLFVGLAREATRDKGRFTVALSGGSTPQALYKLLSSSDLRERVDWSKTIFFFGDERCVPPDSPESNFRMAYETLLEPLGIDGANVFRWKAEETSPEAAAEEYEAELARSFGTERPAFDLVLLGMGSDGHTASLFPHTVALNEQERNAVANWVPKLNAYRLTFTYPILNAAANVVFLVSGSDKAAVLRDVLYGPKRPDDLPSQGIQPQNGKLTWLIDDAAASFIRTSGDLKLS